MLELELVRKEDKDVVAKVGKFFEPLHRGHSEFQIRNFILNDEEFPLPDDKYHQAMMEAYGRYEGLNADHYEWTTLNNEIAMAEYELDEITGSGLLDDRKKGILSKMKSDEITFKRLRISILERRARDVCREIRIFLACMDEQLPNLKYQTYEEKEKEHWLRVYVNQKIKGRATCNIPRYMLLDEKNKKLMDSQGKLLTGGER